MAPAKKHKVQIGTGAPAKAKQSKEDSTRATNEKFLMALLHHSKQPLDFESVAKELGIRKGNCQVRYCRLKKIYYPNEVGKPTGPRNNRESTNTKEPASAQSNVTGPIDEQEDRVEEDSMIEVKSEESD
ncbi:hypothetical protein N7475_002847 [Penicillium sp. IBT 31633x]|nr:hypothetical protein N7475_002847 [Penicillium sp. IBT 31633x]